ncbi:hypothetical protein [Haladaptatus salinisoli]|uniref:hypothetical protein n=1 Tax=Haladaptatus salinisoli TaxID=2884876 RepID=UPI001D0A417D|nr:hypothetical protein [Haladaptatus salinisoli]
MVCSDASAKRWSDTLLVLAGYVVASNPESGRPGVTVALSLGAVALLLITIPLYGEATVAP